MRMQSEAETQILKEEAERMARANMPRPEISRALAVPLHTLARWAFEGRWRTKDLAAEGEAERIALLREQAAARR